MAESKYTNFIGKLINRTKEEKISWSYLDQNIQLCREMNWLDDDSVFSAMSQALAGKNRRSFSFNVEDSFYCKVKDNYIVLYVTDNDPATLLVIPPTCKSIVQLTPDEYGSLITRLLNLVKNRFPSADAFIDDFLEDKE